MRYKSYVPDLFYSLHHLLGFIPLVRPLGLSWLVFLARTLEGKEERMKWWGQHREWEEVDMIKLHTQEARIFPPQIISLFFPFTNISSLKMVLYPLSLRRSTYPLLLKGAWFGGSLARIYLSGCWP